MEKHEIYFAKNGKPYTVTLYLDGSENKFNEYKIVERYTEAEVEQEIKDQIIESIRKHWKHVVPNYI
jgi:hypothetical protein